ncbi:MAG: hypothetical protein WCZ47_04205 [Bacilli bacterium]|jgi:hypothetical protein|nr:hypothetical protein [Bacilli bacterium]
MTTTEIYGLIGLIFTGITIISSIAFGVLNYKKSEKIENKIKIIQDNSEKNISSKDSFNIDKVNTFDNRKEIK